MAPHAGTTGLKVLLAGTSQLDLGEAQAFLSGEGAAVTTSFCHRETVKLLQSDDFDVAVVEVEGDSQAADAVARLAFLTDSNLPVVVALDFQDAVSMVKAVELGAVDILQKPISSQTGRLGTLWQHTLRKRSSATATAGGSESHNNSSGAGSTAAEPTVCTAGYDLVKAILPDLFEVDIWESPDEQNTTGNSGEHGSSIDTPETPDISHHLRQDLANSQSLLSCYHNEFSSVHSGSSIGHDHMVTAHSVNSALSPVLVPQVVSVDCDTTSYDLQPTFSECLEYFEGDPCEDTRQSKKQKVEWTRELHDKFVSAVEALSVDKAVPSKILERMGSCSEGLTRQNIASHLQKYRNRKRSRQNQSFAPFKPVGSAHLPPLLPAPTMGAWGPSAACWPAYTPSSPHCAAPYTWSQGPAAPVTPNIALTISEMLTQPQGAPPLGLKLDTAAVLAQMSNTRLIQA